MSLDFRQLEAQALNEEVRYWINHNLKNYVKKLENKKLESNLSEIEHIIDYLNSDRSPDRLRKMSYKQAKAKSEEWLKALVKKGANLDLCEDVDFDVEIDFNDGFRLVRLKSQDAFKREGNLMGHCVASYFNRSDCSIYSLWDSRDMPHCTLELQNGSTSFNQVKGKGNGHIHVSYIRYILDTLKHFKVTVRDSEMRYLGYQLESSIPSSKLKLFKSIFKYQTLTLGKKLFIYMPSLKEV